MVVISPWPRLVILCLLLAGCSPQLTRGPSEFMVSPADAVRHAALLAQYQQWRGTPYRLGGLDREGVDCSGFVQLTFAERLGHPLPRTTAAQHRLGRPVSPAGLAVGDLVFFKTSVKVRHVGIYLGEGAFLHASTSRGVMVSRLDNPYWRRHYWKARRILPPPGDNGDDPSIESLSIRKTEG